MNTWVIGPGRVSVSFDTKKIMVEIERGRILCRGPKGKEHSGIICKEVIRSRSLKKSLKGVPYLRAEKNIKILGNDERSNII